MKYANYKEMIEKAVEAGEKALYACKPTPVVFVQSDLSDNSIGPETLEEDGDCGGAYITGINGNDPFIKWAKVNDPSLVQKGVYKGYDILGLSMRMKVSYHGQSAERKEAFATAAVEVFKEYGVKCYVKAYLT